MDEKDGEQAREEMSEEKHKPKMDVLDLPALNLSESDSSDSEGENIAHSEVLNEDNGRGQDREEHANTLTENDFNVEKQNLDNSEINLENRNEDVHSQVDVRMEHSEDLDSSNSVIQNIWDNFKNYQANKEKLDTLFTESDKAEEQQNADASEADILPEILTIEIALRDHDYCIAPEQKTDSSIIEVSFIFISWCDFYQIVIGYKLLLNTKTILLHLFKS